MFNCIPKNNTLYYYKNIAYCNIIKKLLNMCNKNILYDIFYVYVFILLLNYT